MTEHQMFFSVEGDEDHERYSFHLYDPPPPPQVGDPVLFWIDMADVQRREAKADSDEDKLQFIADMERRLFVVTKRHFEVREMLRGKRLPYWVITMRHATDEEKAAYGHDLS